MGKQSKSKFSFSLALLSSDTDLKQSESLKWFHGKDQPLSKIYQHFLPKRDAKQGSSLIAISLELLTK